MRVKDKVVLITGAARGIGRETALRFAAEGAKLALGDRDLAALETLVREIAETGGEALAHELDVTRRASADAMVRQVLERFGRIDVLINNAGITMDATLAKMSEEQFDAVLDVNLKGVFNVTQAVLPAMLAQEQGVILNASSVAGLYGNIGQTNYAATKAGVIGMTKTWAKELGRKGLRVNAVAPGFIATAMTAAMPEKVTALVAEKTPLGRLGTPGDVANAYLFLASDDASFITGQVLGVDGGLLV